MSLQCHESLQVGDAIVIGLEANKRWAYRTDYYHTLRECVVLEIHDGIPWISVMFITREVFKAYVRAVKKKQ